MGEISSEVNKLRNNLSLCENEIRAKNLEINELLKEKYKWECRIVELGGPNYKNKCGQYIDSLGGISIPNSTIKVFGIAKTLPEYKEMLNTQDQQLQVKEIDTINLKCVVLSEEYYGELDKNIEGLISSKEKEKELEIKKKKPQNYEGLTSDILIKLIESKKKLLSSA
ncbi:conserved eukaryotic [Cryptosporidium xiaoi]|uniref:Conserved eukaryotic n=1 Tax=Cryptosporidium xiaoi TaxID=659607 RepID=A0AAV9XWJ4_9CRYT